MAGRVLCADLLRRRGSAFLWAAPTSSSSRSSIGSIITVRFTRNRLPAGVWAPFVFKDMKKPTLLSKEYLDYLEDGTCKMPINFGIYDGTPLGALPTEYLVWLSNDFRSDCVNWRFWRDVARSTLKERQSVQIGKRKEFIIALIKAGNVDYSLELLKTEANQVDLPPGYAALIEYCRDNKALKDGIKVHNQLLWAGFARNNFLGELLIDMYGKCNMVDLALQVFDALPKKLVSTWKAMIQCYVDNENYREAVEMYKKMDLEPDQDLLMVMFDCCSRAQFLGEGRVIHACLLSSEVRTDLPLRTAIFEFYAICGDVDMASRLFINLEKKKSPSWNLMIRAYVRAGKGDEAFETYKRMDRTRSAETFVAVLGGCSQMQQIKIIEADIVAKKLLSDESVKAALKEAKDRVAKEQGLGMVVTN